MKKIILIHTVQSILKSFPVQLQNTSEKNLQIDNILDEFIVTEANRTGQMSIANKNRLFFLLKSAELAAPDLIVVTCSTLTPLVGEIRQFIQVPVIAIDDAMCLEVAKNHRKIIVMATAESTFKPTIFKLQTDANSLERELDIDQLFVPKAMDYLNQGKQDKHDQLLLEAAQSLQNKDYDAIVLAQASMAHMEESINAETDLLTYSSPSLCIRASLEALFA